MRFWFGKRESRDDEPHPDSPTARYLRREIDRPEFLLQIDRSNVRLIEPDWRPLAAAAIYAGLAEDALREGAYMRELWREAVEKAEHSK